MFADSAIAQKMNCGPTKLYYLICFGIAPYLKQQLLNELKEAQCFVISFDESLNTELHEEQVDFVVRYFNKDWVTCRYLTSEFFGYTCVDDLKKKFEEGIKDLGKKKMQISFCGSLVYIVKLKAFIFGSFMHLYWGYIQGRNYVTADYILKIKL